MRLCIAPLAIRAVTHVIDGGVIYFCRSLFSSCRVGTEFAKLKRHHLQMAIPATF